MKNLFNKYLKESSNIMGMDFGAISIEQSPSEFGEQPTNAGIVSPIFIKSDRRKKIKFKRKVK